MTRKQKAAAWYRVNGFYVYSAKDRAFIKLAGPTRSRLGRAE
jgi:hypothetical protein